MKVTSGVLALVSAGMTTTSLVSASTIKLPLRSAAIREDGLGPRGTSKFRTTSPSSSGVKVPVTDWFNRTDNQWYTTFQLGTPPQNFTALLDTGSPQFIVGASNCTTCGTKRTFDASLSETYVDFPGAFVNYTFNTGADSVPLPAPEGATGWVVQDRLGWGDLVVEEQMFVMCDTMADALNAMPIDGIMGLSIQATSNTSWFWNLYQSGQLDWPYFSFYTPPGDLDGGEVTLGGIDETKYEGAIQWTHGERNVSEGFQGFVLNQYAIYADGVQLTNGTTTTDDDTAAAAPLPEGWTILDTGTAFMQVPDYGTAAQIYAQISPAIVQIDPAGAWGAPCDELDRVAPDLTFTLGGSAADAVNVTIPRAAFNLGEYPVLDGICQAIFSHPSEGLGGSWFVGDRAYWLVGSPLLKHYYTVWDGADLRIGWAQIAGGPGFE